MTQVPTVHVDPRLLDEHRKVKGHEAQLDLWYKLDGTELARCRQCGEEVPFTYLDPPDGIIQEQ